MQNFEQRLNKLEARLELIEKQQGERGHVKTLAQLIELGTLNPEESRKRYGPKPYCKGKLGELMAVQCEVFND